MVVVAVTHNEGQQWIKHLSNRNGRGVLVVSLSNSNTNNSDPDEVGTARPTNQHHMFTYPEIAAARRRFPSSSSSLSSLSLLLASFKPGLESESELRDRLRVNQAPEDCATARYHYYFFY